MTAAAAPRRFTTPYDTLGAWTLAIAWFTPLALAFWTAFHPAEYATKFSFLAPLTFDNFTAAWNAAPFARYFVNTTILVVFVVIAQFVLCTLAAYAFARYQFAGSRIAFLAVMIQLAIVPDALIVGNYKIVGDLGLADTIVAIALPYLGSAFGIFLLRQTFLTIPKELVDVARLEGAGTLRVLLSVYVPLAKPVYIAYGLVIVSFHWNNLLWPLIVTNSVGARPVTVGLRIFAEADQGIDWGLVTAATLMTSAPLLVGFLIFQNFFVQSFLRAGIK